MSIENAMPPGVDTSLMPTHTVEGFNTFGKIYNKFQSYRSFYVS